MRNAVTRNLATTDASTVWKALDGIVCLFKPASVGKRKLILELKRKLCAGGNYSLVFLVLS